MNVLTGSAHRRWIMPSTQLLLDGVGDRMIYVRSHRRRVGLFGATRVRAHHRKNPRRRKFTSIRLPPTTVRGARTYFKNRRYRINPLLQHPRPDAKFTFDKPLPDGRRVHGEVKESKGKLVIKRHIDVKDPHKFPIGHLKKDLNVKHRDDITKIKKRKLKK